MSEVLHQQVIAAIPNYNMASSLAELLPSLLEQRYDQIYVLDDASTDNSVSTAKGFEGVNVVAGTDNRGSGGNRNRILDVLPEDSDAVIHFIDADTSLETPNTPDIARTIFADSNTVAMGGLVKNTDDTQFIWNWGGRFTPSSRLGMTIAAKLGDIMTTNPAKAERYWKRLHMLLHETPNPFEEPMARDAFWVSEANLLIRAATFRAIGGFDPNVRVHDIFDVAVKLKLLERQFRFDPSIAVVHKAIDVRSGGRQSEENAAMLYLFRKHGLKLFF